MRLNITSTMLDKLGFSEYWDENGDWGGRTLDFEDGTRFRIAEYCEQDDDSYGYDPDGSYVPNHYKFIGWFAIPKIEGEYDLFFLHEMRECLSAYYPWCVPEFDKRCERLKMSAGLLG